MLTLADAFQRLGYIFVVQVGVSFGTLAAEPARGERVAQSFGIARTRRREPRAEKRRSERASPETTEELLAQCVDFRVTPNDEDKHIRMSPGRV